MRERAENERVGVRVKIGSEGCGELQNRCRDFVTSRNFEQYYFEI